MRAYVPRATFAHPSPISVTARHCNSYDCTRQRGPEPWTKLPLPCSDGGAPAAISCSEAYSSAQGVGLARFLPIPEQGGNMRKYVMGIILLAAPLIGVGCSEHHYSPYGYNGGPYYGSPY